jgi:hypothetical protein
MLRLTREGEPNLFIYKSEISYIEEGDGKGPRARRGKAPAAAPEPAGGESNG